MTSKRTIEKRLGELEQQRERRQASAADEMSEKKAARIETHCEAMIDQLSSDEQAALEQAARQIEQEPEDAETSEDGLTNGQHAYLNAITGGVQYIEDSQTSDQSPQEDD